MTQISDFAKAGQIFASKFVSGSFNLRIGEVVFEERDRFFSTVAVGSPRRVPGHFLRIGTLRLMVMAGHPLPRCWARAAWRVSLMPSDLASIHGLI